MAALAGFLCACSNPLLIEMRDIPLDIRYATENNFTGQQLYAEARCFLRPGTAGKLREVEAELREQGLGLKLFDCYRQLSVQRKMWALVPDERYVADPVKGSRHNRGAAVDLTLVRQDGSELQMPTGYDEFTDKAHRNYMQLSPEALRNRTTLEHVMTKHGFVGMPTEWWHFDDSEWQRYPVMNLDMGQARR